MRKIILALLISTSIFSVSGTSVMAQNPTGPGTTNPTGPGTSNPTGCPAGIICLRNPFSGGDSLFALLKKVVNDILLPIGGVLAVLAFIYSGFLYVTAQGNETKLKKAHTALLYTAIGTALLLGAWVFANAICETIALISREPNLCPD